MQGLNKNLIINAILTAIIVGLIGWIFTLHTTVADMKATQKSEIRSIWSVVSGLEIDVKKNSIETGVASRIQEMMFLAQFLNVDRPAELANEFIEPLSEMPMMSESAPEPMLAPEETVEEAPLPPSNQQLEGEKLDVYIEQRTLRK